MRCKVFKERVSLYDHLSNTNPYIYGVYQLIKVQFTFFLIYLVTRDSIHAGRLHLDLSVEAIIIGGWNDWITFTCVEVTQLLGSAGLYAVFLCWWSLRGVTGVACDVCYFLFLIGYFCASFSLIWSTVHAHQVVSLPRVIIFIEWARLCMKSISFVCENAYKVLHPWKKDDEAGPAVWYAGQMSPRVGSFSQYIYFLFAPTLLYRDHYPRNKGPVNCRNVACYSAQFVVFFLLSRVIFMEVQFPKSFKLEDLLEKYVTMLLTGPLMNCMASLLVLHAWFNLTAELTRFADREFYKNWWFAVGYTEYYRLWNVPIHDFNNTYIYQTLVQLVPKSVATLVVFIISSTMHDFFIGVSMGFFLPVFLFLFAAIGGIVFASGVKFSPYLTFFLTCVGYILFQVVYYTEIAARHYCPPSSDIGYFSYQTPYCFTLHNNNTYITTWML